jgi:hypothetical protein
MTTDMRQLAFMLAATLGALGGCSDAATAPGPGPAPAPDYLQLAAQTTSPAPGRIETAVMVTTQLPAGIPIEWGGCTVAIKAFRTAERTAPVWDSSAQLQACPAFLASRRLTPDTPAEFMFSGTAAGILGDSLPPGRYYFSAAVALNRTQFDVPDAGELDLGR